MHTHKSQTLSIDMSMHMCAQRVTLDIYTRICLHVHYACLRTGLYLDPDRHPTITHRAPLTTTPMLNSYPYLYVYTFVLVSIQDPPFVCECMTQHRPTSIPHVCAYITLTPRQCIFIQSMHMYIHMSIQIRFDDFVTESRHDYVEIFGCRSQLDFCLQRRLDRWLQVTFRSLVGGYI